MISYVFLLILKANVYHSTSNSSNTDLAVKVYKTSILPFKDRDKYVSGEFKFVDFIFVLQLE